MLGHPSKDGDGQEWLVHERETERASWQTVICLRIGALPALWCDS